MKGRLLLLVLFALIGIGCWYTYRILTFESDREWTRLAPSEVPFPVLDTLKKQLATGIFIQSIILDESYKGQVSYTYEPDNQLFLLNRNIFTIHCKGKTIKLVGKEYNPPYVFYQGKIYCSGTHNVRSTDPLQTVRSLALDF